MHTVFILVTVIAVAEEENGSVEYYQRCEIRLLRDGSLLLYYYNTDWH